MRHTWITLLYLPFFCYSSYLAQDLSLEQQVGQLLMCHFHGKEANEDARVLIQELHVGGIIYYSWANELSSPQQVFELSTGLQELREPHLPPLLIATDQEGGIVARLSQGFTVFPGNAALGAIKDPDLAEEAAYVMGTELHAVGINMNLAPVIDVLSNPRNPVIGTRSFGESVQTVITLGRKTIQGYHRAEVLTTLKHFPGYGDVSVDPHEQLPYLKKSKQQLQQVELFPFKALASETDAIMTAHLKVPALDPLHCATLSKNILDILRTRCAFQGLIVSDSLMMDGLMNECPSIEEAALQALNAGCDILLLGGKKLVGAHLGHELTLDVMKNIHAYLVHAAQTGRLSQERLQESVQRILNLKAQYHLLPPLQFSTEFFRKDEHLLLAKKIASLAIHTIKKTRLPSLDSQTIALFAPQSLKPHVEQTALLERNTLVSPLFFKTLNPSEEEMQQALAVAQKNDVSIFCCYNAWIHPQQEALIHALIAQNRPVILFILSDSVDAILFPEAAGIIVSFSSVASSIEAAYETLLQPETL
jgi:beta-N-acetylhexosaminidase